MPKIYRQGIGVFEGKIAAIVIILLLMNTAMLGIYMWNITGEEKTEQVIDLNYKRELARDFLNYNRRQAAELDVLDRGPVKEALASFSYEIDLASSSDELTQVILTHGRRVQEIVVREWDRKLRDQIFYTVNQDPLVQELEEEVMITLRISQEEGIQVIPENILHITTLKTIRNECLPDVIPSQEVIIDLEVKDGTVTQVVPYNPLELVQALTEELDALRLQLHETRAAAGYSELSGAGVIVKLYDAPDGYTSGTIVHDTDVRDLVNELLVSGAKGVAVGGYRLTATTSIRCVGSLIKVNDNHIPVNPVTIEAVGDPQVLESGLDILRKSWELTRGVRMEIEQAESLTLPPAN
ncbi:MAG: DUF881 domain-containing protein [Dethiobacteria bacterium]|jgi:hypothetical protein|nr:DUF881 domain-containing protein [Bacillota bacterium]